MGDALWVRVVDLPAALSGRTYGHGGPFVLEVRDAVCEWNDGRWKLEDGTCERTDAEPDLALDVSALGSAYLGAISFTQLREALRVEELWPTEQSNARMRSSRGARSRGAPKSSETCTLRPESFALRRVHLNG